MSRTARPVRCPRSRRSPLLLIAALALLASAVPHPATAGPMYRAFVSLDTRRESDEGSTSVSLADEIASDIFFDGPFDTSARTVRHRSASARASGGSASAAAHSLIDRDQVGLIAFRNNVGRNATGSASFRIDDLVVTPIDGSSSGSITVSGINLDLTPGGDSFSESLLGSWAVNPPERGSANAIASVSVGVTQPGRTLSGSRRVQESFSGGDDPSETSSVETSGLLEGWEGGTITTPSFDVTLGEPFAFEGSVTASAHAFIDLFRGGTVRGVAISNADFSNTFSFATSGPVFNVPDGFTVNSAQGNIVDNRFVGAQQTIIPEPSSLALLGVGAIGLAGAGWRRKRIGQAPEEPGV